MAEMWRPLDIRVYQSWVSAILNEASDDLSDWEIGFIESIDIRLTKETNLTQAQAEKLESIYSSKTK